MQIIAKCDTIRYIPVSNKAQCMKYTFIKHPHKNELTVWYDKINIGTITGNIRENKNLDWDVIRADKSIRIKSTERWYVTWTAKSNISYVTHDSVGNYTSKNEAAAALLQHHRSIFKKVNH